MIATVKDVYAYVNRLIAEADRRGLANLAAELGFAMKAGSTGLEVLGGIRLVLIRNRETLRSMFGHAGDYDVDETIKFIDAAYRNP